jgi:DnaJ-class molecular chaperone
MNNHGKQFKRPEAIEPELRCETCKGKGKVSISTIRRNEYEECPKCQGRGQPPIPPIELDE